MVAANAGKYKQHGSHTCAALTAKHLLQWFASLVFALLQQCNIKLPQIYMSCTASYMLKMPICPPACRSACSSGPESQSQTIRRGQLQAGAAHFFCFSCDGLKALTTSSFVAMKGPSIKSIQAGMDWNTCKVNICLFFVCPPSIQPSVQLVEDSDKICQSCSWQTYVNAQWCSAYITVYTLCHNRLQTGEQLITSSKVSRIDLGLPGRLMINDLPRSPAVCRDKTAVGTYLW